FLYLNTSKRSVTLRVDCPTGTALFRELVVQADILVESFPSGTLEGLGLGYDALSQLNPGLVVTSIRPFGQTGPYSDHASREINLYAIGGLMHITGEPDREPLKEGASLSQYGAGQNAFVATLTALWHRELTGEGQWVDLSMAEYNVSILENAISAYSYAGHVVSRSGNHGYGRAAWGIYPCQDGHVGIIAGPVDRWPAVAEIMQREELRDPRFATQAGRGEYADEVDALMLPWLVVHGKLEIFNQGQEQGLAFAYVASPQDLLECEQLQDRGYFVEVAHPVAGRWEYPGAPFKTSQGAWHVGPAPLLGQHNNEVFCGRLGYSQEDLVVLRQMGAI
ncbi:MAG: CoA transferase, partial [Dehalococcoidia bacterium]